MTEDVNQAGSETRAKKNANLRILVRTVAENVASVYVLMSVIMQTESVQKGVLMDSRGTIVKKCVHLDSSDLIVHSHVATIVREMEHVTMSLEFVTKVVKKDYMVVYVVKAHQQNYYHVLTTHLSSSALLLPSLLSYLAQS